MEYIKENIIKLKTNLEWDKFKTKWEQTIEKIKNNLKKNKFLAVASTLFLFFSIVNVVLITYFMRLMKLISNNNKIIK